MAPVEKVRLLQRAQRVAQLRHPHLVRMLPLPGGARLTPVLNQWRRLSDFAPNGALERLELEQVVRLLLDVLGALTALQRDVEDGKPFVHGEVSPQQIYIDDDGGARLVPLANRHFAPGASANCNGYTAPELSFGDRAHPHCDLFSVGVMLWEALAGARLFSDPTPQEVNASLLEGRIPPLVPATISPWARPLCAIAERAISIYPWLRFQSASELRTAIVAAVGAYLEQRPIDTLKKAEPGLGARSHSPRLPPPPPRRLTPPATVIDIAPAPERSDELGAATLHAGALPLSSEGTAWRRRARLVGLAVAVLAAAALLVFGASTRRASLHAAAPSPPSPLPPSLALASPPRPPPVQPPTVASLDSTVSVVTPSTSTAGAVTAAPASSRPPSKRRRAKPREVLEPDYGF